MRFKSMITQQLSDSSEIKMKMISACTDDINSAAGICIAALKNGKKILFCGNGGSAADAQHLATELMGGLRNHHRAPFPAIALTTDSSFLTAWTNDTDFESVFSRQVEGLGSEGDILLAISTSGNSANIISAIHTAKKIGMLVIAFTGISESELTKLGDAVIQIPSRDTQRIQEGHITAGHILCDILEQELQQ